MIPRTLHRVWLDEPVPELYERWWERFGELHPGWELRTWASSEELSWMQNWDLFRAFPARKKQTYAFRADVARYEILARHGGVYVDTDCEPLRPLDGLLAEGSPFVAWCSDEELDPSVLGSPPGHPAILAVVDALGSVSSSASSPPGATGPRFLTGLWRARPDVRRLPPISFFPFHWRAMEREDDLPPERSLVRHHWAAGWKP